MANIIADACVGKIYDLIADHVIKNVKRHVAYVIRYKDKVQELEQKNTELSEKKERIQEMVDRETNCGRVIIPAVSSWLEKLVQMEAGIANLPQQENEESFKCFKGCMCPNLTWRYKRGKEADKRKSKLDELIKKGDELKDSPVARYTSFQWEPEFDSSQYYTMFSSRASVVDDIKNALKDSNVDMIGVHGPGGAGKTTMVKEVAKEAKKLGIFDKIVIAVVSKDPNISKLQEDIATQLDLEYKQKSELGRADELRKALLNGKRKILVTLDDLWQVLHLRKIGIPNSGLGDKGCKILLTSRDEGVFKGMSVHSTFSIGYLEPEEAWELFKKVTEEYFGVDEFIARKVCEKCAGLPIAIVAVGAALKGEEEFEWQNALDELEKSSVKYIEGQGVEQEGYTPLKWSYDFLKDEGAKSCFLLCCLFEEDAEISIDDLVRWSFASGFLGRMDTLEVARIKVQSMVNRLKKSCLLLNGAQRNFVKMHDVIRDLAISITKEKQAEQSGGQDWPENNAWKHYPAMINDDIIHFPCDVFHCPLMHTLALKRGKSSLKIPNDFFPGMEEARVLALEDMMVDLPSLVLELNHLRMLELNNCQLLGGPSTIHYLKNHIEILNFKGYMIEELPQEIGELIRLRSLDMRECTSLKVIPKGVISKLINLEELYVSPNFKKWETTIYGGGMSNANIAELKSLSRLTVLHVGISGESFTIMMQECPNLFKKLSNFAIFIGDSYSKSNRSPNVLEIDGIHHIDEFHLLMDKVEELRLSNIQDMRYLLGKPQRHFTLSDGRSFTFRKLTYLKISECNSSKYLFSPSFARTLQQLQTLKVQDCSKMEQIIGVGDHYHEEEVVTDEAIIFSRLRKMHLKELPQFRSFCLKMQKTTIEGNPSNWTTPGDSIFNEEVSFPLLEDLEINELPVKAIWNKQMIQSSEGSNNASFSQLKNVKVTHCRNLVNVFPSNILPQLQKLETLQVQSCPSLTSLVSEAMGEGVTDDGMIKFYKLNNLILVDLPDLESFYQSKFETSHLFNDQVSFPLLKNLKINELSMKAIWNKQTIQSSEGSNNASCSQLKNVEVTQCHNLVNVFPSNMLPQLQKVETLRVWSCHSLTSLVLEARGEGVTDDCMIKFCKLEELILVDLPDLESFYQSKFETSHLFNDQVSFPLLKNLKINELSMKAIWNKQTIQSSEGSNNASCSQLKNVEVTHCHNLVNVFPSNMLPQLQKVETLRVRSCHSLTSLVSEARGEGVTDDGMIKFYKLNNLILVDLPDLESFYQSKFETSHLFNDQVSFPLLKNLKINELSMKAIWNKQTIQSSEGSNNASCSQLKNVEVTQCHNLVNVFPSNMLPQLQKVETLRVRSCHSLTSLVLEARGEGVTDDCMIKFCKLEELILVDLPDLESFYQSKFETSHLFNDQVSFPLLEDLEINELPVKVIWNKQTIKSSEGSNNASFSQLKNVKVTHCRNLVNVFPSNILPQLQKLETLQVQSCPSLTSLVSEAMGEGVTDDGMIKFYKLNNLILVDLPDLESFYQSKFEASHLFNDQVSFPLLKNLKINELSMKAIWNKQTIQSSEGSNNASCSQLKNVEVTHCHNLVNVFPSNMLPQLQKVETLRVRSCHSLTSLVSEARGEGVTDDGMIKFYKLNNLILVDLPDLESFYQSKFETSHLFNDQVSFPLLKNLKINELSMKAIWNKQTIQSSEGSNNASCSQLKNVEVTQCHNLVNVFPSNMLPQLQKVETLRVRSCHSLTSLVLEARGEGVTDDCMIKFCKLEELILVDLPDLESFYQSKFETSHLFNDQVSFPLLEDLEINELPVKVIWNKQTIKSSEGSNNASFSQLKNVKVTHCRNLVNVFPSNILPQLQKLETLQVQSCPSLTSLVSEAMGEGVTDDGMIKFYKLNNLILVDLPDLESFYQSKFEASHLFNDQVSFPLLEDLEINELPVKVIWNKQTIKSSEGSNNASFSQLKNVKVTHCRNLVNVFPSNILPQLQKLETLQVQSCPSLTSLVSEAMGEGVTDDGMIKFYKLNNLILVDLPDLESFYQSKFEASHLFNDQVSFPLLKNLKINELSMKAIWNKQTIQSSEGSNNASCSQLKNVEVTHCHNLVNVFPSNMLPQLQKVETLRVRSCHSLTSLVSEARGEGVTDDGMIKFYKLNNLILVDLPDLESFYQSKFETSHLFNDQVSFPLLKNLKINELSMKAIWNKQTIQSSEGSNNASCSQLKNVEVTQCHNLVNVFPSNMLPQLQKVETLRVRSCHSLTSLVLEARGEGVTDDCMIKFCKLEELILVDLPDLESFYQSKFETSHLFNDQVSFPLLEDLEINELPVKVIWNKQTIKSSEGSNNASFSQLKNVKVTHCRNLVNVFPSNILPQLQKLETLQVQSCPSLTSLVSEAMGEGVTDDGMIKFYKLNNLILVDLPDLESFYQSKFEASHLFNDQVSFPLLKNLKINELSMKAIWNKQTIQSSEGSNNASCSQLKNVEVTHCHNLVNVFPSNMLPQLQKVETLRVRSCHSLTSLVSEARGEGVTDDGMIKFYKLNNLILVDLPDLESFYQSKFETSHLFNDQVIFPKIEYLFLENLNSSREIQLWDLLTTTQEHLEIVKVVGCQVSTKVSSHYQKRSFKTIDKLYLKNCQGFKHVIDVNGTISIGEEQFVDVKIIKLYDLPELVLLWSKNFHEIGCLRSLEYITIKNCPQLKNLFTHFMAAALQHLKILSVTSCEMMEEIIIIEKNNFTGEEKATRHIEFPKLRELILFDLPNLKNFCNDERCSYSFSSLRKIKVKDCPKMKTFASGHICLPPGMTQAMVGDQKIEITDLNAFFELRNEDSNHMMKTICTGEMTLNTGEYNSDVDDISE
ncbi:uncharacterized protein LOC127791542 isoform X11 [Diospyros lotus]|uniref:uncharacterized protein LOC127791542 isoform X11 n=1 Tax=Diospyros lotus TaxID=55363 RepID=UPI002251F3E8|nr:uncharacterized protein LOC127791542 isoform X11 [Diospyros lotus]